jgi:Holliday junction resolvase RusA-like endonuclease
MTEIKFIVEGEPIGKARPRFRRMYVKDKAGQPKEVISTYTPQKTVKYEDRVREAYLSEAAYQPMRWPDKQPLEMIINAYMSVPKSASRKAIYRMISALFPTKKPDVDNIFKGIADSLNGVAYRDDSQIVSATINKIWSTDPRAEVIIRDKQNMSNI